MRRRSVKFLQHKSIKRLYPVIGGAGLRINGECELSGCAQREVSAVAEEERANV